MQSIRLIFRQRTIPLLQAFLNKNIEAQLAFLGYSDELELQPELARAERLLASDMKGYMIWDLIEKDSNKVIGSCGFHNWQEEHARAELGYRLHEQYRNKGFMFEALQPVISYGFTEMELNRIEAFIDPDNIPSIKLIEKLEFSREGLMRAHHHFNGKIHDSAIYSLLRREYLNK